MTNRSHRRQSVNRAGRNGHSLPADAPASAETEAPTDRGAVIDPYSPETYKLAPTLTAAAGVVKVLTDLYVGPPLKQWFVRRHPDAAYSLSTYVIELRDEREEYLVLPHLWPDLMGEACFKPKRYTLAITLQGKLFLWAARLPLDDTKPLARWMVAPLEALRLAQDKWVRLTWNEGTSQHDVAVSKVTKEPEWPTTPFRDLLKLGFGDRVMGSLEHPALKRLRGEA